MILAPAIFESEKILGNGLEYFHLDMAPTWSNYHKLVFPNNRTGLSCTQRNFNIMRLLAIAETGHFIYKFQNGMPETFSYRSSFSDLVKDRTPQYTELVSRRAKELLDRDFPAWQSKTKCNSKRRINRTGSMKAGAKVLNSNSTTPCSPITIHPHLHPST